MDIYYTTEYKRREMNKTLSIYYRYLENIDNCFLLRFFFLCNNYVLEN